METDAASFTALTKHYIQKFITGLGSHFLDHNILTLLGIFDPKDISDEDALMHEECMQECTDYGHVLIEKLCTKFKLLETATKLHFHSFIKFVYNFSSLKSCKTAEHLCMKVLLQEEQFAMQQKIIKLIKIAMTVPLSTAWPECNFLALKRVKSFMCNCLLSAVLNALMQISLNGSHVLSNE